LCQQVGDTSQLFPVLYGLWLFSLLRAELQLARELGEQLLHLAQQAHDVAFLLVAHQALGITSLWQGELLLAREHLEQGMALYDPQQHRSLAFVYGTGIGMTCWIHASWVLWLLGYPDQALKRSHEGINLAQELSHPYSLSFALDFSADLHQFRHEWRLAQERAEAAMALATEQGFAMILSRATILRGWVLAEQGQGQDGIAQMHQGLAAYGKTGAKLIGPYFLTLLAEVCGQVGQPEEGLRMLAEGLALVDKNGERCYEAELYRLKGELMLHQSSVQKEAEACFQQAIDIARRQSAKSLELRATMSLARLWQQQNKRAEAHALLVVIYGWFTEGFDTRDLHEAKALLAELTEGQ
jgi:predicted ATPase